MNYDLLKLYTPRPVPDPVTDSLTFTMTFHNDEERRYKAFICNTTFHPDLEDPTVLDVFMGGVAAKYDNLNYLEKDQNVFYYDTENGTVEISLISKS